MKSFFATKLDIHYKHCSDCIGVLNSPLVYYSEHIDTLINVPTGFESDGASVPRVPIIYERFGGMGPREGYLHDYLYRIDSNPVVPRRTADYIFKESMTARGKSFDVRWGMWMGVCVAGWVWYHKKYVKDSLC